MARHGNVLDNASDLFVRIHWRPPPLLHDGDEMTDSDETNKKPMGISSVGISAADVYSYQDACEREMREQIEDIKEGAKVHLKKGLIWKKERDLLKAEVEHWRTKYGAYVDKWCDTNRERDQLKAELSAMTEKFERNSIAAGTYSLEVEQLKADISSREQTYYVALTNMKEQCAKLEVDAKLAEFLHRKQNEEIIQWYEMCEKLAGTLTLLTEQERMRGYPMLDEWEHLLDMVKSALPDYNAFLEKMK